MKTCPHCGAPVKPQGSEIFLCEFCGETIVEKQQAPRVENRAYEQPSLQREVVYVRDEEPAEAQDADNLGCWLWGACFIFPLIGLILFLSNKSTNPAKANSAGTAAIIGFVTWLIFQYGDFWDGFWYGFYGALNGY